VKHGCKYGNKDCPVVNEKVKQLYTCETCDDYGIKSVEDLDGCLYCKGKDLLGTGLKDDAFIIRKGKYNKELYIKQKDYIVSIEINYCPKCGGKL
jgi:hypothetical protein